LAPQRGKKKSKSKKDAAAGANADGTKRVYVCPHCQRSYDWNYNLNRHLKYECGKENAFQCAKCGRKFPHKQVRFPHCNHLENNRRDYFFTLLVT
jgi:hypothetical protein